VTLPSVMPRLIRAPTARREYAWVRRVALFTSVPRGSHLARVSLRSLLAVRLFHLGSVFLNRIQGLLLVFTFAPPSLSGSSPPVGSSFLGRQLALLRPPLHTFLKHAAHGSTWALCFVSLITHGWD